MFQSEYYKSAINPGDCISNSWSLISQNYWLFFGMAILTYAIMFFLSCIPLVGVIINGVISGPLFVGIYHTYLKKMRGEEIEFGMMFFGFERFFPAMIVGLVTTIPYIILQIFQIFSNFANVFINPRHFQSNEASETLLAGMGIALLFFFIVFLILFLAVNILMFFALPLIAERDNLSIGEIMKLSMKAAWGNIGGIIILFILQFLVALAGTLALCVGVFFVLPVIYGATAFAYRQVFPQTSENVNTAPPMPNEYGSSFGQGH